jgi:GTP-binding protein
MREHWGETVPRVLHERRGLVGLLLLADARLPLKQEEMDLLEWCAEAEVPVQLALNKADKLNRQAAIKAVRSVTGTLKSCGMLLTPMLVSATVKSGIDDLRGVLHGWFEEKLKEGPGLNT